MIAFLSKQARRLRQYMLNSLWYTHPVVILLIQAAPAVCLRTLADAARPSTQRLHLRNLFTDGRRYFLTPANDGFQMTSTSKIFWQRRRRTRVAAVLFGKLSDAGEGTTRVQLRGRMTPIYLLDVFVLPLWMGVLLVVGPISKLIAVGSILVLLILSWLWHRYNAVLQTSEMVYFVQVALDDLTPAEILMLGTDTQNMVYSDFQTEWQKFYEQHKGEQSDS